MSSIRQLCRLLDRILARWSIQDNPCPPLRENRSEPSPPALQGGQSRIIHVLRRPRNLFPRPGFRILPRAVPVWTFSSWVKRVTARGTGGGEGVGHTAPARRGASPFQNSAFAVALK